MGWSRATNVQHLLKYKYLVGPKRFCFCTIDYLLLGNLLFISIFFLHQSQCLANFYLWPRTRKFPDMFFKRKENQPQDHDFIQMRSEASVNMERVGEKIQADASKDNNDGTSTIYPSGIRLVLLMMSCFIAMFLVALVSSE